MKQAHGARTVLASALLALVAAVNPVNAATEGVSATDFSWDDPGIQAAPPEMISPAATPASITELAITDESVQEAAGPVITPVAAPVITPTAPTLTTNGLLQFTSKAEFQAAFPGLAIEDFEGGTTAAGAITVCTTPLDSTSTCAGLTIADGLSITGPPSPTMVVVGSGFGAWAPASTSLATVAVADTHQIAFSGGNVNAVGFDLTGSGATTATVNVFGASGLLQTLSVSITTVTQTFTGIYSTEPITFITITAGLIRVIDNIQFGAIPTNLTFYTSQATFTSAHPGLPVEDFEESTIGDSAGASFVGPLNSSTSNAYFSPGDILGGLNIDSEPVSNLYVSGGNNLTYPNTTKAVATNITTSNFKISFPSTDVHAVGMDLSYVSFVPSTGDTLIAAFNPFGKFLGMNKYILSDTTETFCGVYSADAIGWISILNNVNHEFVDNIRFGGSPADLTFYYSEASFLMARPGLPVEDFEESPVADGGVKTCTQPINSATNEAGCFSPGDILPGITFQPQAPCAVDCTMAVLGAGYNLAPSKEIAPSWCVNDLEITFAKKNVRYFGSNIRSFFGPADYLLSFYDDHGNFIGSALRNIGATPIYLGAVSQKHISKILVTDVVGCEIVDNVRFGAFPWQTIIPAISGH